MKRRRIRGIQGEEPARGRDRREKNGPGIAAQRFDNRLISTQTPAHTRQSGRDYVDGIRHCNRHDDDRYPGIGGIEHRTGPTGEPHGRVDGEHNHDNGDQGAEYGSQKNAGQQRDDKEYEWYEFFQIVLCDVGEGAIHDNVAGEVIGDVRMARAGLVQECVKIIGYLNHRGIRVFGQDEIDRHPGHASVMGDQAPGDSDRVQCDLFDSLQVGVTQRLRVIDERFDNQVVAERFAMGIIGAANCRWLRSLPFD